MTDFLLVEQLHRMMGELPRPRLMYRKGIGMRGYFKIYRSFEEYTSADIFCEMDRSFPVRARFSALLGVGERRTPGGISRGSPCDCIRGQASMMWCVRACRCFLSTEAGIFWSWQNP